MSKQIVVVGGGATGVELAADLHNVAGRLQEYGFEKFSQERLEVSVTESPIRTSDGGGRYP